MAKTQSKINGIPEKSLYFQMFVALPRRLKDLFNREKEILIPENWQALHMMRIAAKRLRYSMELYQLCFDKSFREKINTVKTLQDHLGAIQDCVTLIAFLEDAAEKSADKLQDEQPDISDAVLSETEKMIMEQILIRGRLYAQFTDFWNHLTNQRFKETLLSLIETTYKSNADKTNDLNALERIFIDEI